MPRTLKQLRAFLESRTGPADHGHKLAASFSTYLAGKTSEESMGEELGSVLRRDRQAADDRMIRKTGGETNASGRHRRGNFVIRQAGLFPALANRDRWCGNSLSITRNEAVFEARGHPRAV